MTETTQSEKMPLTSMDIAEGKRDELKRCLGQAFPEVFAEGSIDFDQLKRVLGEWVDPGKERYGLN
jgi:adenine-specific DNA-methyltransferase